MALYHVRFVDIVLFRGMSLAYFHTFSAAWMKRTARGQCHGIRGKSWYGLKPLGILFHIRKRGEQTRGIGMMLFGNKDIIGCAVFNNRTGVHYCNSVTGLAD